ncbi:hypothetical protein COY51_03190, partial [Candidatus Desantisbacteria bacterium CG_4_10_14_0_8_um_filter_39_17]
DTYTIYSVGAKSEAVAVGDINNDSKNDVVIVSSSKAGETKGLCVFLQNETGTFNPKVIYPIVPSSYSVAIGDLNNDGRQDVAVANDDDNIRVFIQNNTATLDAPVLYPVCFQPDSIKIGDVNNDGKNDVVVSNWNSDSISVLIQNVGGTLNPQVTYAIASYGNNKIDIGDINNDGRKDVIVMRGKKAGIDSIAVFIQNATNTLDTPAYYKVSGTDTRVFGMAIGSVNGDTKADIVTSFGSSYIAVFTQTDTTALDTPVNYTAYNSPSAVAIGDVSGDGKNDVVVLHNGQGKISVYKQSSLATLSEYKLYSLPYSSSFNPHSIALGDINSDSICEILIADPDYGLIVLRQVYSLSFVTSPVTVQPNQVSSAISVQVLNGDREKASVFSGTVTLSTSSSTGKFSINKDTWVDTTIIMLNSGEGSFYYKDQTLGYHTIVVSRSGFTLASQLILVEIPSKIIPYNNVFNPAKGEKTTIWYDISSSCRVTIKVYNLVGELVKVLVDEDKLAGQGYSIDWKGENSQGITVASGVYLIHISAGSFNATTKALVIK